VSTSADAEWPEFFPRPFDPPNATPMFGVAFRLVVHDPPRYDPDMLSYRELHKTAPNASEYQMVSLSAYITHDQAAGLIANAKKLRGSLIAQIDLAPQYGLMSAASSRGHIDLWFRQQIRATLASLFKVVVR